MKLNLQYFGGRGGGSGLGSSAFQIRSKLYDLPLGATVTADGETWTKIDPNSNGFGADFVNDGGIFSASSTLPTDSVKLESGSGSQREAEVKSKIGVMRVPQLNETTTTTIDGNNGETITVALGRTRFGYSADVTVKSPSGKVIGGGQTGNNLTSIEAKKRANELVKRYDDTGR